MNTGENEHGLKKVIDMTNFYTKMVKGKRRWKLLILNSHLVTPKKAIIEKVHILHLHDPNGP